MAAKKQKVVLLTNGLKSVEVTAKAFKASEGLYLSLGYSPASQKQVIDHIGLPEKPEIELTKEGDK